MIDLELLQKVVFHLKKNKITCATAESCTGGLLAHLFTSISGSSDFFDRGIVAYSNTAKTELLNVSEHMLKTYGAVSEQTAKAMASGIKKNSNVTIGISTTGIAGPTGGTKDKPVGLVYIGLATPNDTVVKKFLFTGNRLENKENTCTEALQLLLAYLSSNSV